MADSGPGNLDSQQRSSAALLGLPTSFKRSFDQAALDFEERDNFDELDLHSRRSTSSDSTSTSSSGSGRRDRNKRARSESNTTASSSTLSLSMAPDAGVRAFSSPSVSSVSNSSSLAATTTLVTDDLTPALAHISSPSLRDEDIHMDNPFSTESSTQNLDPAESFRISMDRYTAFDEHISALRGNSNDSSLIGDSISRSTSGSEHNPNSGMSEGDSGNAGVGPPVVSEYIGGGDDMHPLHSLNGGPMSPILITSPPLSEPVSTNPRNDSPSQYHASSIDANSSTDTVSGTDLDTRRNSSPTSVVTVVPTSAARRMDNPTSTSRDISIDDNDIVDLTLLSDDDEVDSLYALGPTSSAGSTRASGAAAINRNSMDGDLNTTRVARVCSASTFPGTQQPLSSSSRMIHPTTSFTSSSAQTSTLRGASTQTTHPPATPVPPPPPVRHQLAQSTLARVQQTQRALSIQTPGQSRRTYGSVRPVSTRRYHERHPFSLLPPSSRPFLSAAPVESSPILPFLSPRLSLSSSPWPTDSSFGGRSDNVEWFYHPNSPQMRVLAENSTSVGDESTDTPRARPMARSVARHILTNSDYGTAWVEAVLGLAESGGASGTERGTASSSETTSNSTMEAASTGAAIARDASVNTSTNVMPQSVDISKDGQSEVAAPSTSSHGSIGGNRSTSSTGTKTTPVGTEPRSVCPHLQQLNTPQDFWAGLRRPPPPLASRQFTATSSTLVRDRQGQCSSGLHVADLRMRNGDFNLPSSSSSTLPFSLSRVDDSARPSTDRAGSGSTRPVGRVPCRTRPDNATAQLQAERGQADLLAEARECQNQVIRDAALALELAIEETRRARSHAQNSLAGIMVSDEPTSSPTPRPSLEAGGTASSASSSAASDRERTRIRRTVERQQQFIASQAQANAAIEREVTVNRNQRPNLSTLSTSSMAPNLPRFAPPYTSSFEASLSSLPSVPGVYLSHVPLPIGYDAPSVAPRPGRYSRDHDDQEEQFHYDMDVANRINRIRRMPERSQTVSAAGGSESETRTTGTSGASSASQTPRTSIITWGPLPPSPWTDDQWADIDSYLASSSTSTAITATSTAAAANLNVTSAGVIANSSSVSRAGQRPPSWVISSSPSASSGATTSSTTPAPSSRCQDNLRILGSLGAPSSGPSPIAVRTSGSMVRPTASSTVPAATSPLRASITASRGSSPAPLIDFSDGPASISRGSESRHSRNATVITAPRIDAAIETADGMQSSDVTDALAQLNPLSSLLNRLIASAHTPTRTREAMQRVVNAHSELASLLRDRRPEVDQADANVSVTDNNTAETEIETSHGRIETQGWQGGRAMIAEDVIARMDVDVAPPAHTSMDVEGTRSMGGAAGSRSVWNSTSNTLDASSAPSLQRAVNGISSNTGDRGTVPSGTYTRGNNWDETFTEFNMSRSAGDSTPEIVSRSHTATSPPVRRSQPRWGSGSSPPSPFFDHPSLSTTTPSSVVRANSSTPTVAGSSAFAADPTTSFPVARARSLHSQETPSLEALLADEDNEQMEYLQAMVQIQDTEEMHFTATETTRNSANSMGRANRASEAVVQAQNLVATARARMDAEDRRTANLRTTLRRQEEALREERRRQVRELEAAIVNHAVATRSAAADATTTSSRTVNSKDTTTDRNPEGSSVNVRPLQSNPSTSAYAYRSRRPQPAFPVSTRNVGVSGPSRSRAHLGSSAPSTSVVSGPRSPSEQTTSILGMRVDNPSTERYQVEFHDSNPAAAISHSTSLPRQHVQLSSIGTNTSTSLFDTTRARVIARMERGNADADVVPPLPWGWHPGTFAPLRASSRRMAPDSRRPFLPEDFHDDSSMMDVDSEEEVEILFAAGALGSQDTGVGDTEGDAEITDFLLPAEAGNHSANTPGSALSTPSASRDVCPSNAPPPEGARGGAHPSVTSDSSSTPSRTPIINLNAYHDGPFRASLARTVELNRLREEARQRQQNNTRTPETSGAASGADVTNHNARSQRNSSLAGGRTVSPSSRGFWERFGSGQTDESLNAVDGSTSPSSRGFWGRFGSGQTDESLNAVDGSTSPSSGSFWSRFRIDPSSDESLNEGDERGRHLGHRASGQQDLHNAYTRRMRMRGAHVAGGNEESTDTEDMPGIRIHSDGRITEERPLEQFRENTRSGWPGHSAWTNWGRPSDNHLGSTRLDRQRRVDAPRTSFHNIGPQPSAETPAQRRNRAFRSRAIPFSDFMRDTDLDASYEGLIDLTALIGDSRQRGTPQTIIDGLASGTYSEFATPGETEERCPICLDDYQSIDPVLKLPNCSHWIHKPCLQQWLKTARTCPVCRSRVESGAPGGGSSSSVTLSDLRSMYPPLPARSSSIFAPRERRTVTTPRRRTNASATEVNDAVSSGTAAIVRPTSATDGPSSAARRGTFSVISMRTSAPRTATASARSSADALGSSHTVNANTDSSTTATATSSNLNTGNDRNGTRSWAGPPVWPHGFRRTSSDFMDESEDDNPWL